MAPPTGPQTAVPSRVVAPAPEISALEGHRPICRWLTTGPAKSDVPVSRPFGYRVKALTLVAPDSSFKSGANSDSVYIDIEDISTETINVNTAGGELPPGKSITIEEVDPGWIHVSSPTANQRLWVTAGGPHSG